VERRLADIDREIDRLVDGIAKGIGDPQLLGNRMNVLSAERKELGAELAGEPSPANVVSLHPAVLKHYENQLMRLRETISRGINAGDTKAAQAMRHLVETVTVFRSTSRPGGVEVEITGQLTALLGDRAYPNGVRGVCGKMVAGEGFEPPTLGL
jgi:site-specific DNA recombinase